MSNGKESLDFFEARVDEVLQSRITSFRRLLLGTFTIALSLFYFLVLPYVSSHTVRSELVRETQRLEAEIERAGLVANHHAELDVRLRDAERAFYSLREELIDARFHLDLRDRAEEQRGKVRLLRRELREQPGAADWIRGEAPRPQLSAQFLHANPRLQQRFKDPCFWLDAELWTLCRISEFLSKGHSRLRSSLGYTDAALSQGFEMRELGEALDAIAAPFALWITDPDITVLAEIDSVRQLLSREMERYGQAISNAHQRVRGIQDTVATELATIRAALAETLGRIETAEAKLERARNFETIETPLGNLPVGLDDLVLLFPAALMVVVYYLLKQVEQSVQLRWTLHRSLIQRSIRLPAETSQYLRITSPLWLEPFDPKPRQIVQALVPALPFATAVFAIYLVADRDFLFSEAVVPNVTMRVLYVLGYVITLSLVADAARQLLATSKRYRAWSGPRFP